MPAWRDEQSKVQHQLAELANDDKKLEENQLAMTRSIHALEVELAVLKAKSVVIGGASGLGVAGVFEWVRVMFN